MLCPFNRSKLRNQFADAYVDDARRAKLTNAVECRGLTEETLGQTSFCQELTERREWIAAWCEADHIVEPVLDERQQLAGRIFFFADLSEAVAFRMRFRTNFR